MKSNNLTLIEKNFHNIKDIENPTPEEVSFAIKKNPFAVDFVPNGYLLPEHCVQAVNQNPDTIQYLPDSLVSESLESLAMTLDIDSFKKMNNPSLNACKKAIDHNPNWFKFVPEIHHTKELCEKALTHDGHNLQYIENQNPDYCLLAMNQELGSFRYVNIVENNDPANTEKLLLSRKYILDNLK